MKLALLDAAMKLALLATLVALPSARAAERCIFEGATLRNQAGKPVQCADLAGKAVALYFAGK